MPDQVRHDEFGLVIVEATAVQANGRIVPGSLGLWEDSQVSSMAKLVKSIKEQGALAVVQLNHAGLKISDIFPSQCYGENRRRADP